MIASVMGEKINVTQLSVMAAVQAFIHESIYIMAKCPESIVILGRLILT